MRVTRWAREWQGRLEAEPDNPRWPRPPPEYKARPLAVHRWSSKARTRLRHVVQVVDGSGLLGYSRGECPLKVGAARSGRQTRRRSPLAAAVRGGGGPCMGSRPLPSLWGLQAPPGGPEGCMVSGPGCGAAGLLNDHPSMMPGDVGGRGWGGDRGNRAGAGSGLSPPPHHPSWPTPSACSWSSPTHRMRRNATRAGKVKLQWVLRPASPRPSWHPVVPSLCPGGGIAPITWELPAVSCVRGGASFSWSWGFPSAVAQSYLNT
jgi:hypothetical protein